MIISLKSAIIFSKGSELWLIVNNNINGNFSSSTGCYNIWNGHNIAMNLEW
jgi:hypothetical protein